MNSYMLSNCCYGISTANLLSCQNRGLNQYSMMKNPLGLLLNKTFQGIALGFLFQSINLISPSKGLALRVITPLAISYTSFAISAVANKFGRYADQAAKVDKKVDALIETAFFVTSCAALVLIGQRVNNLSNAIGFVLAGGAVSLNLAHYILLNYKNTPTIQLTIPSHQCPSCVTG